MRSGSAAYTHASAASASITTARSGGAVGGRGDEDVVGVDDAAGAQRRVAAQLVDLEPERVVLAQLARLGQPLLGALGVAGEPGRVGGGEQAAGACGACPP